MLPDSTLRARISTRAGRSLAAAIDDIAALRSTIADGSHPRVAKRVDLKRKAFAKHAAWKQLPPPDYHNVMPYVAAIDPHVSNYFSTFSPAFSHPTNRRPWCISATR